MCHKHIGIVVVGFKYQTHSYMLLAASDSQKTTLPKWATLNEIAFQVLFTLKNVVKTYVVSLSEHYRNKYK